jgi:flagella basal body P-ring formation protein FlgA
MSRHQGLSISFARTRCGRALLHGMCLVRGKNIRWHVGGIVRELFGRDRSSSRTPPPRSGNLATTLLLGTLFQLGWPAITCANTDAATFSLLPSATVDSAGIFLHQIATIGSLESGGAKVRIAAAPAFGRAVLLTREQIKTALQASHPEWNPVPWTGAESVRVTRRGRTFSEGDVRDLLATTLQNEVIKDRGELELRLARPWSPVSVPDEPLTLKILDLPSSGVSQHFILRFELLAGEDRVGPWQAVAQARVMKRILVAASSTRRGQGLTEADLLVERRDVLPLREPLEESALRNSSLEFIEVVAAGQPILARSVRLRPIVQKGTLVDGLVREGSLQINMRVEVLADGLPGQLVRVRNPKTKREFYAKVQDEQTVLIQL